MWKIEGVNGGQLLEFEKGQWMKLEITLDFPDVIWKVQVPKEFQYFFTWLEVHRKKNALIDWCRRRFLANFSATLSPRLFIVSFA